MVLKLTHNILWTPWQHPLPIWCSTHRAFAAIQGSAGLGEENMSTTTVESQQTVGTPGPLPYTPARTATLVLMAFAVVYVVWGSTYLAIRVGIESFPPLILAGLRHLIVGLFLYPVLRAKTGIRPTAANWRTAVVAGTLLLFVGNGGGRLAGQSPPSGTAAPPAATGSRWPGGLGLARARRPTAGS